MLWAVPSLLGGVFLLKLLMFGGSPLLAVAGDPFATSVADYQAVRKIGLALAVLGFLVALVRMSTTELPSERSRAEGLLGLMLIAFVTLVGDRMIVHGVATWFHLSTSALPAFWQ